MTYKVTAQFAKANAPSFRTPGFESFLSEAKNDFNIKSCLATNPKEITELKIIDDMTIEIVLKSSETLHLAQVSRSLRVFSMYLVDKKHHLNFSKLVSGKRLFKMSATEIYNIPDKTVVERSNLYLIKKIIEIMECSNTSTQAKEKLREIESIVGA